MPRYDPFGHMLLSSAAQRLDEEALDAEADTAEILLRRGSTLLADTEYEYGSAEHSRALLAVVHQINFQVERGVEGATMEEYKRGNRGGKFRSGDVSAVAQAIINTLIDLEVDTADWPIAGSLR